MSYSAAAHFAQTWGLAYAVLLFLAIVVYALWPNNQKTFDRAAAMPLEPEDE